MPIFEYICQGCGEEFELLVRGATAPACPACESEDLEKQLSLPRAHTSKTHGKAMRAARARDKKRGWERMNEQRLYEEAHED